MVLNATAHMNEEESNIWFCQNHGNHTVFDREESHYYLRRIKIKNPQAHKGRCEGWLKVDQKKHQKEELEAKKQMQSQEDIVALLVKLYKLGPFFNATDLLRAAVSHAASSNSTQSLNTAAVFNATAVLEIIDWEGDNIVEDEHTQPNEESAMQT